MSKPELIQNVKLLQKAIIIDQNSKILALKRSKNSSSRPNNWDLPGGNIEKTDILESYGFSGMGDQNDILIKSIAREILEETGLRIKLKDIKPHLNASGYKLDKDIFIIALVYTYNFDFTQPIVQLSNEHIEYQWLHKDDFFKLDIGDDGGLIMSAVERV